MPIIHYHAPIKLLVAVRGHPFDRSAFDAMFLAMDGITATMVDQPAAAQLMNPAGMAPYDALVLYDMPGLDFTAAAQARPSCVVPDPGLVRAFRALLEQGIGIVALHHALAGWPAWPEYGDWLGGRFLYHPADVHGVPCLDSGFAHSVTYEAEVLAEHPVTDGLPRVFSITDEPYMAEIFTAEVTPLLASQGPFHTRSFLVCRCRCERQNELPRWLGPSPHFQSDRLDQARAQQSLGVPAARRWRFRLRQSALSAPAGECHSLGSVRRPPHSPVMQFNGASVSATGLNRRVRARSDRRGTPIAHGR